MKCTRHLIVGAAVGLAVVGYELLPGPKGRSRLPAGPGVPMVSLGVTHGLAVASDGSLWSWGGQDSGRPVLGLPQTEFTGNLLRLGRDTNWVLVAAGAGHNLALRADGRIWAWGANWRGQLGNGVAGPNLGNGRLNVQDRPAQTVEGSDWVAVEAGDSSSYALKRDGTLWAWGWNDYGQLGIGSWTNTATPVRVGTATNWVKVRAGGLSAAGIQSDGSVWIWGGSLALGPPRMQSPEDLPVPTRLTAETNWSDVSVTFNLSIAVKADGTLWAWGRNAYYFTGAAHDAGRAPTQVGHAADWRSVWSSQDGSQHLLLKQDGTFWVMTPRELRKVGLPPKVLAAAAGGRAIAAITREGEVWTCGTVLGQRRVKDRFLHWAEGRCRRLGWDAPWAREPRPIVHEEPWRLRNRDPHD